MIEEKEFSFKMFRCSTEMFKHPQIRATYEDDRYAYYDGKRWQINFSLQNNSYDSVLDEYVHQDSLEKYDNFSLEDAMKTPKRLQVRCFQRLDNFYLENPPSIAQSFFQKMKYEDFTLDIDSILVGNEFVEGSVIGGVKEMTFQEFLNTDEVIVREWMLFNGQVLSVYWRLPNETYDSIPNIIKA